MGFFTGIDRCSSCIPDHQWIGMGYRRDYSGLGTVEVARMGILCPEVGSCVIHYVYLVGPLVYQQPKRKKYKQLIRQRSFHIDNNMDTVGVCKARC